MCFSAGASFGASIALGVIGAVTLQKAKNHSQIMFAAIPLIFSIQQFFEGIVWLSFTNPEYAVWREKASYTFLFFAHIVWPVWVPLAMLLLENEKKRIRILQILSLMGIIVSVSLAYCLVSFNVQPLVRDHHIIYEIDFPELFLKYGIIFYVLVTVVPAFISGIHKMKIFGFVMSFSYLFSEIFFNEYLLSVWCFFAAVLSIFVFIIIQDLQKITLKVNLYFTK